MACTIPIIDLLCTEKAYTKTISSFPLYYIIYTYTCYHIDNSALYIGMTIVFKLYLEQLLWKFCLSMGHWFQWFLLLGLFLHFKAVARDPPGWSHRLAPKSTMVFKTRVLKHVKAINYKLLAMACVPRHCTDWRCWDWYPLLTGNADEAGCWHDDWERSLSR